MTTCVVCQKAPAEQPFPSAIWEQAAGITHTTIELCGPCATDAKHGIKHVCASCGQNYMRVIGDTGVCQPCAKEPNRELPWDTP